MSSPVSLQLSISDGAEPEVCLKFFFLKSCVIALATFAYLTARLVNIFHHKGTPVLPFMPVINSGLAGDPSLFKLKNCCDGFQQHLLIIAAFISCLTRAIAIKAEQFDLNGFCPFDLRFAYNSHKIFQARLKHV